MKHVLLGLLTAGFSFSAKAVHEVKPLTEQQAREYKLDTSFYRKVTLVQGILIATSAKVSDLAHRETAYQFDMLMRSMKPEIAERIRRKKRSQIGRASCRERV